MNRCAEGLLTGGHGHQLMFIMTVHSYMVLQTKDYARLGVDRFTLMSETRAACGQSAQHQVGQGLPISYVVKAAKTSRYIGRMSALHARSL
jgi:hypothetical protein